MEAERMSRTRMRKVAAVLLLAAAVLARPVGALAADAGPPHPPAPDNGVRDPDAGAGEARDLPPPPAPDNVAADNAATVAVDNAAVAAPAASETSGPAGEAAAEEPAPTVADPLEPVNRAIFVFNDKAYFWV